MEKFINENHLFQNNLGFGGIPFLFFTLVNSEYFVTSIRNKIISNQLQVLKKRNSAKPYTTPRSRLINIQVAAMNLIQAI